VDSKQNYFLNDPNYFNLSNGSVVGQSVGSGAAHSSADAYFAQLDYAFADKYLLGADSDAMALHRLVN